MILKEQGNKIGISQKFLLGLGCSY